jgi:hypothetical protein
VAALIAVPFAVLSALVVAFFGVIALAFSNGEFDHGGWLVVTIPALLAVWLLVGALLLLLGRSWLAVFLPALTLVVVVVWAVLAAGLGEDTGGLLVLLWGLPGVTAVLSALPGVRRWIALRKLTRLTRD